MTGKHLVLGKVIIWAIATTNEVFQQDISFGTTCFTKEQIRADFII